MHLRALTVSIVLPVRRSSVEHGRHADRALRDAREAGALEVVVAEDTSAPAELSQRSRAVNAALPGLRGDWVLVVDPRVVAPLADIVRALATESAPAVQTLARLVTVDRERTELFYAGDHPDAAGEACLPGRGAWAARRDLLLAAGGLDEGLQGPAEEGLELFRRLRAWLGPLPTYDHVGLSLWAPRPAPDLEAREAMRARYTAKTDALARDPAVHLRETLETSLPPDLATLHELARRHARREAVRATCLTPPPERPVRLPGTLWALTCHFNPAGYARKAENHRRFREGLRRANVPLLAVELAFGDAPFELGDDDAERVVRLRGGDALWQKERLLNVGLRALPEACDKVVWLDADVLFARDDWAEETARALERWVVVQPFSLSTRLERGETWTDVDALPQGAGEGEVLHGMAYGVSRKGHASLARYLEHGHSGYAWAARRAVLEKHGLYDANVLGNGDLNIAHAMFGGSRALKLDRFSPAAARHLSRWADAFFEDVGASVGFVEGTLFHLFHGKKEDRRYLDRLSLLVDHGFDPEGDLERTAEGAWRWRRGGTELARVCGEYFRARREDG